MYFSELLTLEYVIVLACTLPTYIFFKDRPSILPSRVAKMRRCSFKSTIKYLFKSPAFYLLWIAFSASAAILF